MVESGWCCRQSVRWALSRDGVGREGQAATLAGVWRQERTAPVEHEAPRATGAYHPLVCWVDLVGLHGRLAARAAQHLVVVQPHAICHRGTHHEADARENSANSCEQQLLLMVNSLVQ